MKTWDYLIKPKKIMNWHSFVDYLTDDGYAKMIKSGIANGIERVEFKVFKLPV